MVQEATTYLDRDNDFLVELRLNGIKLTSNEMAAITKFEILYSGTYYNSVAVPTGFVADNANGTVTIKPNILNLPAADKELVELIIYDAVNTNGLVWTQFELTVKDDADVP